MAGVPKSSERLVQPNGTPTFAWYRVLGRIADLVSLDDVRAFFRALLIKLGSSDGTIENLPPIAAGSFLPITTVVQGDYSIESSGVLAQGFVSFTLVGDEFEPLPTHYYGTGADGARGYHAVADAFVAGEGIALTVDGVGVTEIALATIPDGGAGTLQKTARDAYGRMTDTSAATTDDLTEGAANLYFTDARAVNALETTGPDYLQLLLDEYNP
ncbi:hypothetical protein [Lysobacter capsici]|uniref:hypothetical protein n=1 Tax=Lysobacter capsici TaxID=435897 RepID=UPI00287B665F|nr:hypothetical protein [Lysobacter capsici]WND79378.1 hypothetical protein RJ610_19055 [Lysobacter capsici]WND84574.1 hypothetical protein RJ609_19070 [Lysobacter capsici]